jgi:antitoxin (DNA-binding transcriptional repressor) of toxin-antitoxin stability system
MTTVQIKVLRDNLSKYLRLVKAGEVVLIKDRNTVIAELNPPSSETKEKTEWEITREKMIADGTLIPAKRTGKIKLPEIKGPKMSTKAFQKLLDEVRADRFP